MQSNSKQPSPKTIFPFAASARKGPTLRMIIRRLPLNNVLRVHLNHPSFASQTASQFVFGTGHNTEEEGRERKIKRGRERERKNERGRERKIKKRG